MEPREAGVDFDRWPVEASQSVLSALAPQSAYHPYPKLVEFFGETTEKLEDVLW